MTPQTISGPWIDAVKNSGWKPSGTKVFRSYGLFEMRFRCGCEEGNWHRAGSQSHLRCYGALMSIGGMEWRQNRRWEEWTPVCTMTRRGGTIFLITMHKGSRILKWFSRNIFMEVDSRIRLLASIQLWNMANLFLALFWVSVAFLSFLLFEILFLCDSFFCFRAA
jgi:hypothetical protein